jgi:two-component system sensor histidine kinase KdpD
MNTPSNDIVLACLVNTHQEYALLRTAQRHARAHGVPWFAVYLELWDDQKDGRTSARNRVLEQLALAERMGAQTFVTKAADYTRAFQEVLAECGRRHARPTLVLVEAADMNSPGNVRRSVAAIEDACRGQSELMVLLPTKEPRKRLSWLERLHMRRLTVRAVAWSLALVALAYTVTETLAGVLPIAATMQNPQTYLIYLIACAIIAGRFGLLPGMIATVSSFVLLKWFTVEPLYSLNIAEPEQMVTLGLFLLASTIISLVNSQVHAEAEASEINEWRMQALLQIYKIALHARSRNEALAELHGNLQQFLHAEIAVYMPSVVSPELALVWPQQTTLEATDIEMLRRCWEQQQAGSKGEDCNPHSGWRFEPLTSAAGDLGMLALRVPAAEAVDTHFDQYLRMIAELVASILEKIESTDMKEESRVRDEREKLRTSLLSSVSHDLKTPLAAILGSLSVHRSMYDKLPEEQRRELTDAALNEAQRLDSFITNILDLAKIESGAVKFKREWQSPEDLVNRVRKRMRLRFENHVVVVHGPATEVEVELDPVISEQTLLNVLDNAVKYAPSGSKIDVRMETTDDHFNLHVRDFGDGIPADDHERIFDKYTRLQRQDHQVAGTGLGLALARAAMRGQGGDIRVSNHVDGGAVFTLSWPQWRVMAATGGKSGTAAKTA